MRPHPLRKITEYFLHKYEHEDFILQQKARIVFTICGTILVFIIPIYLLFSFYLGWGLYYKVPILMLAAAIVITLFLLRSGRLLIASHTFLAVTFSVLWSYFFINIGSGDYFERMLSAVLVLGLLTFTPLIVDRMTHVIIFYYSVNIVILAVFIVVINNRAAIPGSVLISYAVDTMTAFIMSGAISYHIYSINRLALDKAKAAEDEIRKSAVPTMSPVSPSWAGAKSTRLVSPRTVSLSDGWNTSSYMLLSRPLAKDLVPS